MPAVKVQSHVQLFVSKSLVVAYLCWGLTKLGDNVTSWHETIKPFSDMTECACRVPYTEARRAACTKTVKLDEMHVVAQQLLQETHLAHCRKNHASYKCRNAQQRILHLLDEARQVQLFLSCGLLLLLMNRPCGLLLANSKPPAPLGTQTWGAWHICSSTF